jgi:AhpD family alkylhydroperoxidase
MLGLEKYLSQCGLDETLLDLIKLRVSQINGCAYCLDMHWKDLRARGESEQRLYGLDAWEGSPYYNEREPSALIRTWIFTARLKPSALIRTWKSRRRGILSKAN